MIDELTRDHMKRSAILSECGVFRYWLTREWDATQPTLAYVMLNPSTADADADDPTIRKCIGFARRNGYGGIVVVNLFAYRATSPKVLRRAGRQVGPENDKHIARAVLVSKEVICAWGAHARKLARPAQVLANLRSMGVRPMALKLANDGTPWHPLMLPYSSAPVQMGATA